MFRLRVKEVIKNQGKTVGWVARKAGLSHSVVRRMVKDPNYTPQASTLLKVARVLKCSLEDLIEYIPEEEQEA
ncbi:helix-turn-helix domain-containing protein [Thermogemmatispora tikiterensis]|uniref:helix-turn-helix domain-containing protein n=1 Tax=Thermogemmatispora tikiterensis TaxID=1825093 RepID=UPI000DD638E8